MFLRYVDSKGAFWNLERHVLPRLDAALDQATLAPHVLLPGRLPVLLSTALAPGPEPPPRLRGSTIPSQGNAWTMLTWEGPPGETVVWHIGSSEIHYQELTELAVHTDGTLRRLPVRDIPLFGAQQLAGTCRAVDPHHVAP